MPEKAFTKLYGAVSVFAKKLMLLLVFCIVVPYSLGARVYGTVYDLSLDPVPGAIIEVNTTPSQRYLSQDGSYELELPLGSYILTATELRAESVVAFTEEEVIVGSEGSFILDLIVYPEILDESELLDPGALALVEEDFKETSLLFSLLVLTAVVLIILVVLVLIVIKTKALVGVLETTRGFLRMKREPPIHLPSDLQELYTLISAEGGRITQRELRKNIPLSEAKVSLMVAELVELGLVKKFKRGRGNVLVLIGKRGRKNR